MGFTILNIKNSLIKDQEHHSTRTSSDTFTKLQATVYENTIFLKEGSNTIGKEESP